MRRSSVLLLATLAWLGVIALITLTPNPRPPGESSDLVRAIIAFLGVHSLTGWFDYDVAEFTANVLMFVPLGALVAAQLPPRRRLLAALIGLGVSVLVETVQLLWLPSRVADVRDLVSNGTGSLLGSLLIVVLLPAAPLRKDRTAHAR